MSLLNFMIKIIFVKFHVSLRPLKNLKIDFMIHGLNRHFIVIITLAVLTYFIQSCVPAYVPNVVNAPLLSNQGELQVAIHTGTAGNDPQIAYAVTENIGLMLNGSFANRTSDSTDNFHKHNFLEFGGGYFDNIGTSGRFEVYGGFGMGNLNAFYNNSLFSSYEQVTNNRLFIQPAIGAATDVFDGSFATRFVMANMSQGDFNSTGYFFEPVITGRMGYKYLKLMLQLGLSFPVSDLRFEHQPLLFSIGLQGYIGRKSADQ